MEHLSLLLWFLILSFGVLAFFYTYQTYKKYKIPLLKYLLFYIVTYNFSIFIFIILNYIRINLLQEGEILYNKILMFLIYFGGFFIHIGMCISLVLCVYELKEVKIPEKFNQILIAVLSVLGFNYVYGIIIFVKNLNLSWLANTYYSAGIVSIITIFVFLLNLIYGSRLETDSVKKRVLASFGILYFLTYASFFITPFTPSPLDIVLSGFVFIFINIIPVIWLKYYFLIYYDSLFIGKGQSNLDIFSKQHNITKREKELIELLLKGKTNEEITELLFISKNTVKNQLYNLYKKLGVKSRTEVIYLISKNEQNIQ